MSEEQKPIPMRTVQGPVEMAVASDVVPIYANAAAVHMTAEECMLMFGVRNPGEENKARAVTHIYLSLSHAKRLHQALGRVLQATEERFGPIELDPAGRAAADGEREDGESN